MKRHDAETRSCLYFGRVTHKRLRPFRHRLAYRVFSLYVDLDELPLVSRKLRLFSHNRWNLFSFMDCDHGARDRSPLRPWIERELIDAGIDLEGGAIRLFCFPRMLGYVFNPLTIWFCYHKSGQLLATLYEVHNSFGDRHGYLIPVDPSADSTAPITQSCDKTFYVSPFMDMRGGYHFRLSQPDEKLLVLIRHWVADGEILIASQTGVRRPIGDSTLLLAFVAYPLMTLKVTFGIYWHAIRLWRKGAKASPRPPAPRHSITLVRETVQGVEK